MFNKTDLENLVKKYLAEEVQPEPYDPKSDTFQPSPRDRIEPSTPAFQLTPMNQKDSWGRPMYKSLKGRIYVDIELGKNAQPSIYSTTPEGEPSLPVHNFKITGGVKEGEEADAVNDMWAGSDDDIKGYGLDHHRATRKKTLSKPLAPKKNSKAGKIKVGGKEITLESIVKKCVIEVLKERLNEGFDPQSQGPNPTGIENPYEAWNNRMRQMEETANKKNTKVQCTCSTGNYPQYKNDHMAYCPCSPKHKEYLAQKKEANKKWWLKKESVEHKQYAPKTFQEIRDLHDPDGKKHDLTLKCVKCGTTQTCKCSKPKRTMSGICEKCSTLK